MQQTRYMGELTKQLTDAREDLQSSEEETGKLELLREVQTKKQQEFDIAEGAVKATEAAQKLRSQLVSDLALRAQAFASCIERIDAHTGVLDNAERDFEAARGTVTVKDQTRTAARTLAKAANGAIQDHHDRADQIDLLARLTQARKAEQLRLNARAVIAESETDNDVAGALAALETELRVAETRRAAATAHVRVRRLGSHIVTLNGASVADGEEIEASVLNAVTVAVDGVLTVEVQPGTPPAELDADVQTTSDALVAALTAAGVDSVQEARDAAARRRTAESDRDSAESTLQLFVGESSIEALEQRLAGVKARIELNKTPTIVTADIGALEKASTEAREAEQLADDDLLIARESLEKLRAAHTAAREASLRSDVELERAQEERDRAAESLASARQTQSDESLADAVAESGMVLAAAEVELFTAQATLKAAGSETLEMHLRNARQLVESKQRDLEVTRKKVDELGTLISDRMAEGIYDKYANAKAALEAARDSYARQDRAARAASLLKTTMDRHREEAQQKYVAPFKERIERLGKVIFGDGFSVQVSQELIIESRTLDGHTVPFESLSAGTREQISLLGRLACAQLVDAEEGAPVILDDTLGFADPQRLVSLNVVLNDVGRTAQVVLLTCQPQRFATLGGAHVVRLPVG